MKTNLKIFVLALCAMFCSQFTFARIIYVDLHNPLYANWAGANHPQAFNNANSWAMAIPDLQYAMYYAQNGDEIWVKETPFSDPYVPMENIPPVPPPNGNIPTPPNFFWILNDVHVYGGFAGWERSLNDRVSWFINQTHLSTYQHVADYTLYMQGSNSLIDGFYIDFYCPRIAGIVMESGTADDNQVISNTIIKGNIFKYSGFSPPDEKIGIINVGGSNTITPNSRCISAKLYNVVIHGFTLNSSGTDQNSLINVDGGRLTIHNVTIADNVADPRNHNPNGIPGLAVTLGMGGMFGQIINTPIEVTIINTIIWYRPWYDYLSYNNGSAAIKLEDFGYGTISAYNSDIMDSGGSGSGFWTRNIIDRGNNIDADPEFLIDCYSPTLPANLSHIWYELCNPANPVVDAGSNTVGICLLNLWWYNQYDLKNEDRIENGIIDMGAFEWQNWQYNHTANIQRTPRKNDNQDNENNLLQIYPNPASETAILQLGDLTSGKVFITDLQGRTLETFNITKNNLVIDVTKYQTGIYLVRIVSDKINVTERLIVSK